jgi:hypothetical protein
MIKTETELVHFQGGRRDLTPPTKNISGIGSAAPDVFAVDVLRSSGGTYTITDFVRGAEGQVLRILGDSNITIAHNARIKTNTGVAKVLVDEVFYTFLYYNGVWYEAAI